MTNLNESGKDWNGDIVSLNRAVVGSGMVNRLTTVIHRIWDIFNVDLDKRVTMEGEDGE